MLGLSACTLDGPDTAPRTLGAATEVSIGMAAGCARREDGQVLCWGGNSHAPLAADIPALRGATVVSAGNGDRCALFATGAVRCQAAGDVVLPETPAAAISTFYSHACALLRDGTIQCWGTNTDGELGVGNNTDSDVPSTVVGITGATGVSVGHNVTCAALTDGTARCWGANSWGQLGDGTKTNSTVPVAVSGLTSAAVACTGDAHSCALLTDGSVRCWGANSFGQLGDGTRVDSAMPVTVAGIANATTIACGWDHTCVVLEGGLIQCWGGNGGSLDSPRGALGTASGTQDCKWLVNNAPPPYPTISAETPCAATPVQVSDITNATAVAAGDYATCALLTDGSVKCWGFNLDGQLGNGSTSDSIVPVTVMERAGQ
jgi:alpha-tubulin suppressor-like RCC1 family protein